MSVSQVIDVWVQDDDVVRNVEAHDLVINVTSSSEGLERVEECAIELDHVRPTGSEINQIIVDRRESESWMNAFTMTKSSPKPVKTRLLPEARVQEQVALEFGGIH